MQQLLILGAGAIGQAIGQAAAKNPEVHVSYWDKDASRVPGQGDLAPLAAAADCIFLCVPTRFLRDAIESIRGTARPEAMVISVSKSMEEGSAKFTDEVLAEALPAGQPFGILGGPMLAAELLMGREGTGVLGTASVPGFELVRKIFEGSHMRVLHSLDVRGVALAGVIKNIYALGMGIAAGLDLGDNAKGRIAAAAVGEMLQIAPLLGGAPETLLTPAGVGDFVATGFSALSRNWQAGNELGQSGRTTIMSEGLLALPSLFARLGAKANEFPLLAAIKSIASGGADARVVFASL